MDRRELLKMIAAGAAAPVVGDLVSESPKITDEEAQKAAKKKPEYKKIIVGGPMTFFTGMALRN